MNKEENRTLKVIQVTDYVEGNMVDTSTNTELENFMKERDVQKDVIKYTLEVLAEQIVIRERADENKIECRALLETLREIENDIKELNRKVKHLISDDTEYRNEVVGQAQYSLKIKKIKLKLQRYVEKVDSEATLISHQNSDNLRVETEVKLPKLILKTFDGDILKWKQFEEMYEAAIHNNNRIANVQKFLYLLGYLEKAPKEAIENFPLTNENYIQAWQLLNERYGNPQLIISTHMNNLIKLDKVNGANVKDLRALYDKIESNLRALKSIGIQQEQVGPLLIPIVLEKLPNVVRLQISRKLGKENWSIDDFLTCINTEITARESYEYLKQDKEETTKKTSYSGSALVAGSNFKKCVFCQSVDHYSDKCIIVTDVDKRRDLLKRNRICFNCLKGGHIKKNCTVKIKCFKCKTEGHHTVLCNPLLKTSQDQASSDDKKDNSPPV